MGTTPNSHTEVEVFFEREQHWQAEMVLLRRIVSANNLLQEELKWMHPCYTFFGKNIVLIHGFKAYCALLFHKGVLLKDPQQKLVQQTDHVQSARQLRFTSTKEIADAEMMIKAYIAEAISIEQSGKKVDMKKVSDFPVPDEFQHAMDNDDFLRKAFFALSPGRQKGYLFYFSQAKQAKTRLSRVEKYRQHILNGKGIDD